MSEDKTMDIGEIDRLAEEMAMDHGVVSIRNVMSRCGCSELDAQRILTQMFALLRLTVVMLRQRSVEVMA